MKELVAEPMQHVAATRADHHGAFCFRRRPTPDVGGDGCRQLARFEPESEGLLGLAARGPAVNAHTPRQTQLLPAGGKDLYIGIALPLRSRLVHVFVNARVLVPEADWVHHK